MPVRNASAVWEGTLKEGKGTMKLGSGAYEGAYSFSTRFEEAPGTNPEELIGAAHAGCFSMALSGALERAGFPPDRINTSARVKFEKVEAGFRIVEIHLDTEAAVPNIEDAQFQEIAAGAKTGCPISNALSSDITIHLNANLVS